MPADQARAFAGQHQHADIVAELEFVEHSQHLAIERGAHAVALFGAVEVHPGDAVMDDEGNGVVFGFGFGFVFGLGVLMVNGLRSGGRLPGFEQRKRLRPLLSAAQGDLTGFVDVPFLRVVVEIIQVAGEGVAFERQVQAAVFVVAEVPDQV